MNKIMKLFFGVIFFTINVNSQTTLSIRLTDSEYQTKNIEIEVINNTNKKCKIPIDTSDFKPYSPDNLTSLRPFIEIKHKGKQVKFSSRFVELDGNEIKVLNEGKKLPVKKEKSNIIEIYPKETLKFIVPFNPFSFNIKEYTYNAYQILFDEDYELKVYLKSKKTTCFNKIIESNTIVTHWK